MIVMNQKMGIGHNILKNQMEILELKHISEVRNICFMGILAEWI